MKNAQSERLLNAIGRIDDCYIAGPQPRQARFCLRPAILAAALLVCLSCLGGLAAGRLSGFFQDILGPQGAVVGASYQQATDEIALHAAAAEGHLTVEIAPLEPDRVPYSEISSYSVGKYEILDEDGRIVAQGSADGSRIPLDGLPAGDYRLVVREISGAKKADQILILHGDWECAFSR